MFEILQQAPPDAILGLTDLFHKDSNPNKINLSVGVFKDANGVTPILKCVKSAEEKLLRSENSKSYLGIDGHQEYADHVQHLLFGNDHSIINHRRAITVQAPGGTGALRIAGDFIKKHYKDSTVWMTTPTWANHPSIFESAGLAVESFPYFDSANNALDFSAMIDRLGTVRRGDIVVLHGCCHNPCGVDPTPEQWELIAEVLVKSGAIPMIDFAYQGFGDGIDEDASGLRTICDSLDEFFVASSYSKNFGLYRERVGALTVVSKSKEISGIVLSNVKINIRTNYSTPPSHGAAIVQTVLNDKSLRAEWELELAEMRNRIAGMRDLFVAKMKEHAPRHDFEFMRKQRGMFSFSGLSRQQVEKLRDEYSIYIVGSGRINVAGITEKNVDRLCAAISSVL